MSKGKQRLSAISNIAYPISGMLSGNWIKTVAMAGLMVGSGLFHYKHTYYWQKWDERMMYVVLLIYTAFEYVAVGLPILFGLGIATVLSIILGLKAESVDSFKAIPALFVVLITGSVISEGWEGLYPLIPFVAAVGLNFAGRRMFGKYSTANDIIHSLWHLSTAYGFYLI